MTTIRSVSGIPDETWEKAKDEYGNVSAKINELLEKDLRINENEEQHIDLLKHSDLTNKQLDVARNIMRKGGLDKTSQQLGKVINKYFSDREYKNKCKQALIGSDAVPFEKDGKGLKAVETVCPECEARSSLKALRKTGFECAGCGLRLYDIEA